MGAFTASTRVLAAVLMTAAIASCGASDSPRAAPPSAVDLPATLSPSSPAGPAPSSPAPAPPSATTAGPGGPISTARPATPTGTIRLVRSGGIAGVQQFLLVEPDGSWEYTSGKNAPPDAKERVGRLTPEQRAALATLLADPALAAENGTEPGPSKCMDGFTYLLSTKGFAAQWSQCGAIPPKTAEVADLLMDATPL